MNTIRRLAAILATDVAGYSRLMGADEEGTHERLKAHLHELVDPNAWVRRIGTAGFSSHSIASFVRDCSK